MLQESNINLNEDVTDEIIDKLLDRSDLYEAMKEEKEN